MAKHRCFTVDGHDGQPMVIRGDPNMDERTIEALRSLADAAVEHVMTKDYGPNWREQFPDGQPPQSQQESRIAQIRERAAKRRKM